MLVHKPRVWLLGALAMLLVGSFAAASAEAQGPFFYHRNVGEKNNGIKWNQQLSKPTWEAVEGKGGEVKLESKITALAVQITAEAVEVKGIIFNNALQGQSKILLTYVNPKMVLPAGNHCNVSIGAPGNVVKLYGHLAWKWDGGQTQLHEQPQQQQRADWIFLPSELQQGATSLPTNLEFTNITLTNKGAEVCAFAGQFPVKGSAAASIVPVNLGEFSKTETQKALPNGELQHFWNGKENIGDRVELKLGAEPAKLIQETTIETKGTQGFAAQEIAKFES